MAAYDIVIRNGQVADGTGKKLFAADVALKGDRIAPSRRRDAQGRQRDRRQGQGGGARFHRRAHPRRYRPDRQSLHGDEGEPGRNHGGLRQLRRFASPYLRSDIGHFLSLIVKKQANVSGSFAEFAGKVERPSPPSTVPS
jgi:N-acyl-D-aspartate/D-glutamate deacylase